eukprot:364557-Chlamydomonas_euryale.AAC.38
MSRPCVFGVAAAETASPIGCDAMSGPCAFGVAANETRSLSGCDARSGPCAFGVSADGTRSLIGCDAMSGPCAFGVAADGTRSLIGCDAMRASASAGNKGNVWVVGRAQHAKLTHNHHRDALAEHERQHVVPDHAIAQRVDAAVVGLAFGSAVPAEVVVATVTVNRSQTEQRCL